MTIPIVFLTGADPVKDGLVNSLNRPGGNLTGVTTLNVEIVPKRQSPLRATADRDPLSARHGVLCLALGGGSCAAEIFSCPCRLGVKERTRSRGSALRAKAGASDAPDGVTG